MTDTRLGQTRQAPTVSRYGLLGPTERPAFRLDRVAVAADLADLAERHWLVSWDLPEGERATATLLPHPCVNLVFDRGLVTIAGVGRERFSYPYAGRGRVFGVKFRPGGFHPFWAGPIAELTDQTVPLARLWGPDRADALARDLAAAPGLDELVEVAERHLRAHRPPPDPEVARVGQIVRDLLHDRAIARVDDVSRRFGMTPRTLQRLFHRYVGVSPKWVLRRYRLHEAAARLASGTGETGGTGESWTEVAVNLGYFDQSHFIRDFTRAVGLTPTAYVTACQRHEAPVST